MGDVPPLRVRDANEAPLAPEGRYVLYWMIANRRTAWNYAIDRAVYWAKELKRPLVILEPLRCDYPWASDRMHRFVLQGMVDNRRSLAKSNVLYYPYVEPSVGAGRGLLAALAKEACLVVTDDFPAFFLPHMIAAAAKHLPVKLEAVDSNGILPLRTTEQDFVSAYQFRRFLQKNLRPYLAERPAATPLKGPKLAEPVKLPAEILKKWPAADLDALIGSDNKTATVGLADLPIDHAVWPAAFDGGSRAAGAALDRFMTSKFARYPKERNEPESDATSGFSPYLHFGHLSAHEIFTRIVEREEWTPDRLAAKASGSREGWWGMSPEAEAFLDQLITWRELGFNFCAHRDDYDRYESLPDWARATLAQHARDPRPALYELAEFEQAATHDPLWNAAQRQLVREGRMHNYLRMLWGKMILHWTESPRQALDVMIELNNKYAVDGRDPNSYSGIFWCLGRYDRAWGPERPVFGKIRYMTSENTARKFSVKEYLKTYGP